MLNSLKSAFAKLLSKPLSEEPPLSHGHNAATTASPSSLSRHSQAKADGGEGRDEGELNSKPLDYSLHLPDKRNGKIAHLPRDLRDRICQCIYDGASLTKLAEALNQMPEVKSVLDNHFDGVPLSKQNLSEWKAGGYRDWLLRQQMLSQKGETVADAEQLAEKAKGLADSLFSMLTLDYAQIMMNRDKGDDKAFEKKRAALSILSQDVVRLRRCHIQARRVEIQEGCFERNEDKTREQVVHQFAEWASHPDIRRIFILEPANHMRLLRQKFNLPPTKEDQLLAKELNDNHPDSTPPDDRQATDKPRQTEKCEPPSKPTNPPTPETPSDVSNHQTPPSPPSGRLEPIGNRRKEYGEAIGRMATEQAGASESTTEVRGRRSEDEDPSPAINPPPPETPNTTKDSTISPISPAGTAETSPKTASESSSLATPHSPPPSSDYAGKKTSEIIAEIEADYARKQAEKHARSLPLVSENSSPVTCHSSPRPNPLDSFSEPVSYSPHASPPLSPSLYTPPGHNPLKYYGPCPAPGSYDWPKLQYG